ncbi:helix-turn-helix domain-containing protein [Labedaea rhizosphaerae]|uniref:Sugar-specific transcriptional regulator TrmB n=1 Tax=Labedaea rhizosphaerae TaxID=598644 RepID=A0A4R6RUA3_LABRH|nr:helix-turn-helix domain-containing protein [Labedaea rhizosphaerae]TDP90539.1 sugar-specific transcriptional regulator TrmB [Labedaea rhizosphaerae]
MELAVLGLSADEEQVYEALVAAPGSTVGALADHLVIPDGPLADVLAALSAKHLVSCSGDPCRYVAAPPDIAINQLVQLRERELSAARAKVYSLSEIHRSANRTSPELVIEQLTDRETIAAAVAHMESEARVQVRVFDTPPYYESPGGAGAAWNTQTQIARHQNDGIAHRVIYSQDALAWPTKLETDILPAVHGGEHARTRPTLPIKLIIRDDQDALIPFDLSRSGLQVAYLVRRSPLFTALAALFEGEWAQANPLDATAMTPGVATGVADPDEESRSLLAMMMAGLTDTAIARVNGWSTRTTYRRLQRLMTELGASTRFQAGCLAERRGWL